MRNIVIIGFMGTGKTAVCKQLAQEFGKTYISIDDMIEEREGRTINSIFQEEGEGYFRKIEKNMIKEIAGVQDQVIDPGGGIVLDPENMDILENTGIVICLWASPETIFERTKEQGHRPLLNVGDPLGKIRELLEHRRPFYERAAFHINTDSVNLEEVVRRTKEIIASQGELN